MIRSRSAPAAVNPKGPQMSSFLGKASIMGLQKAVDVLDTLGSSLISLQAGSAIASNSVSFPRGAKISILAFEVANTIVKGSHILQSISDIKFLKIEILQSEAVERLVSTDMTELHKIAAADIREEFNIFARDVSRFGNLCMDPQWHNLDRYLNFVLDVATEKHPREVAEMTMQELITLSQYTSELYHELHALDRFVENYQEKVREAESLNLSRRGEGLSKLRSEIKHHKKLVKSLQKKSLWSKSFEEVVEKLVDIVTYMHQHILEVFGDNVSGMSSPEMKPERLGIAGLALHYAHIITQINNISSIAQMKAQLEKTLEWLVPVAAETIEAHQNFGWVGEWAYASMFGKKTTNSSVIRLQTLYHADKEKMDQHILELVICLHQLINVVTCKDQR